MNYSYICKEMRNKCIARIVAGILALLVLSGTARAGDVTKEWLRDNYVKSEVFIPMRDGVRLHTAVYEPRDGELHPLIMVRTPYGLAPYGEAFSGALTSWMSVFAAHSYIIVFQSVRGTYLSEGSFVNIRPLSPKAGDGEGLPDEATDTYDTAEWLLENTSCSGSIGVKGVSYPGYYATMAGLSGHPSIKAISPQAPVCDWWKGDDIHHNGIPMLDIYNFAASFFRERKEPSREGKASLIRIDRKATDYFMAHPDFPSLTENFGERVPYWETVLAHPDYDDYWKSVSVTGQIRDVRPAVLVVGGSYDAEDCYGALETYRALREQSPSTETFFVYGPWGHGSWRDAKYDRLGETVFGTGSSTWFMERIEYPFFAWYLEGKGEKPAPVHVLPSAAREGGVAHDTADDWQTFASWPPPGISPERYYLDRNLLLGPPGSPKIRKFRRYVSDPADPVPYLDPAEIQNGFDKKYMAADQRFTASRKDVLTWTSTPLKEEKTAEGPVRVHLEAAVSTTDADFIVKLIDVRPDGYEMLVRGDGFRARYRRGWDVPEALVPGEKTALEFTLNDIAHVFRKGHRLMVQVQSSWFPLMALSPQFFQNNPYEVPFSDYQKAEITLYNDSWIEIPILQ